MKFTIQFKDPDGVYDAITDAVAADVKAINGLEEEERESLEEIRRERIGEALNPWIEHHENLTVEFDTEAGTATVLKVA